MCVLGAGCKYESALFYFVSHLQSSDNDDKCKQVNKNRNYHEDDDVNYNTDK